MAVRGAGRSQGLAYVEFYLQEATLKALALSGQPIKGQARSGGRRMASFDVVL